MFEMCLDVQEFLAIYNGVWSTTKKQTLSKVIFKMTKRSGIVVLVV